jgi:crossover junction endodeoxyribonuclease RuvC
MFDPAGPVLGIDPGVSRCGYGVVARDGARLRAVACGVLRSPPSEPLPARLAGLADELDALVRQYRPAAVAVERVLFQNNARTAISVGQASGLALVAAARAGVPVVQYSPNEVKLAVTGDGRADKQGVQAMVTRLLGLAAVPKPADAADALALACCHLWRAPLAGRLAAAGAGAPGGSALGDGER